MPLRDVVETFMEGFDLANLGLEPGERGEIWGLISSDVGEARGEPQTNSLAGRSASMYIR